MEKHQRLQRRHSLVQQYFASDRNIVPNLMKKNFMEEQKVSQEQLNYYSTGKAEIKHKLNQKRKDSKKNVDICKLNGFTRHSTPDNYLQFNPCERVEHLSYISSQNSRLENTTLDLEPMVSFILNLVEVGQLDFPFKTARDRIKKTFKYDKNAKKSPDVKKPNITENTAVHEEITANVADMSNVNNLQATYAQWSNLYKQGKNTDNCISEDIVKHLITIENHFTTVKALIAKLLGQQVLDTLKKLPDVPKSRKIDNQQNDFMVHTNHELSNSSSVKLDLGKKKYNIKDETKNNKLHHKCAVHKNEKAIVLREQPRHKKTRMTHSKISEYRKKKPFFKRKSFNFNKSLQLITETEPSERNKAILSYIFGDKCTPDKQHTIIDRLCNATKKLEDMQLIMAVKTAMDKKLSNSNNVDIALQVALNESKQKNEKLLKVLDLDKSSKESTVTIEEEESPDHLKCLDKSNFDIIKSKLREMTIKNKTDESEEIYHLQKENECSTCSSYTSSESKSSHTKSAYSILFETPMGINTRWKNLIDETVTSKKEYKKVLEKLSQISLKTRAAEKIKQLKEMTEKLNKVIPQEELEKVRVTSPINPNMQHVLPELSEILPDWSKEKREMRRSSYKHLHDVDTRKSKKTRQKYNKKCSVM